MYAILICYTQLSSADKNQNYNNVGRKYNLIVYFLNNWKKETEFKYKFITENTEWKLNR
jgi:hypothetical protein